MTALRSQTCRARRGGETVPRATREPGAGQECPVCHTAHVTTGPCGRPAGEPGERWVMTRLRPRSFAVMGGDRARHHAGQGCVSPWNCCRPSGLPISGGEAPAPGECGHRAHSASAPNGSEVCPDPSPSRTLTCAWLQTVWGAVTASVGKRPCQQPWPGRESIRPGGLGLRTAGPPHGPGDMGG